MTPPFRRSVRGLTPRAGEWILAFTVTSVLGCSAMSDPSPETKYVLVTIAGLALPAPFDSSHDTDGNIRTLEAVESSLTLFADGTSRQDMTSVRKLNGEVVESLRTTINGRFERVGETVIVRFDSGAGYEDRIDYEVLENGRQLAGAYFGRVYRWVREGEGE